MLSAAEASLRAATIKRQVGVYGLGVVGAHQFAYDKTGALTFKARLHYQSQSRVRVMRVTITLNALDYYDIRVVHADKWGAVKREASFTDISGDGLTAAMYLLDKEGI